MPTLEEELQQLQGERKKAEAEITNLSKSLQDTQSKLGLANTFVTSLAPRIAAIEKLVRDIATIKMSLKALREKILSERAGLQERLANLQKEINAQLPESLRNGIKASIEKVDKAIAEAKKKMEEAQNRTVEAEAAVSRTKEEASSAEAEYQAVNTQFHRLPQEIELVRGRVDKLTSDVKTTIDTGRVNEAYMRLLELKLAWDEMPNLYGEEQQKNLSDQIAKQRQAVMTAQDNLMKANGELNKRKAE
jgi:chromosome segregation ATPase